MPPVMFISCDEVLHQDLCETFAASRNSTRVPDKKEPRLAEPRILAKSTPASASAAPFILMFGRDRTLLETRGWILSRQGYRIRIATELAGFERILFENPVSLLILCYSLKEQECARARELTDSHPAIQTLRLVSESSHWVRKGPGESLNVFDGPEKLVSTVNRLLRSAERFDLPNA